MYPTRYWLLPRTLTYDQFKAWASDVERIVRACGDGFGWETNYHDQAGTFHVRRTEGQVFEAGSREFIPRDYEAADAAMDLVVAAALIRLKRRIPESRAWDAAAPEDGIYADSFLQAGELCDALFQDRPRA